jgi:hypothetical protein
MRHFIDMRRAPRGIDKAGRTVDDNNLFVGIEQVRIRGSKKAAPAAMTRGEKDKRQAIIDARRRVNRFGFKQQRPGSTSMRHQGGRLIGRPPSPSGDEIERVRRKMAGYGLSNG